MTTAPPQIEQARMRAALRDVEQKIEAAPHHLAEDFRVRVNAAMEHLERAFALWRQHAEERAEGLGAMWRETRKQAWHEVRESRRQWKLAIRMVGRLPEAA